ncbi:MAG: DUF4838 domain-containing protein [Eubacteriales bacterium]|nr:DUF4838 domain-containing protein [Eubacteriales bacterium]
MVWKLAKAGTDPTIAFAADELKKYLSRMDGALEIAILSFPRFDEALTDVLWLGVCPKVCETIGNPVYDDAVWVDVDHGRGSIRGSNPRSVLFGVYRFLRELGCDWVRPGADGEIIPEGPVADACVRLRETPSYRHRAVCIEGAVNYDHVMDMIDWMPKLGMNGYFNQFNNPFTFYDRWYSHQDNALYESAPLSAAEIRGIRDQSVAELKKRGMLYHAAGHGWTCDPFGIPGETWDARSYEITDEQKSVMAEVNGVRELWGGVPLNTNLCYSNPAVRRKMVTAIADYCERIPAVDYLHLWLADGSNNHCECAECVKKTPADWYVTLLNEVDEELTARGLPQKVVFLIYVDLLWAPQTETLHNQDRFVLMFAPITRTYSSSFADCEPFDEAKLPPYERNRLQFPSSVGENLAWLRRWQAMFHGDSFDFDYHFMWDHFKDPGYYRMAEVLFRDMQNLRRVGLNGMVSCQNQRVFFPDGLGMTAMATALWDEQADFDEMANRYFDAAFGEDGPVAQEYLKTLSDAFDPSYLRGEKPAVDEAAAKRFQKIPDILDEYAEIIQENMVEEDNPENVRLSWAYLSYHASLCRLLARALYYRAKGDAKRALAVRGDLFAYARQHEQELNHVFDVYEFQQTLRSVLPDE